MSSSESALSADQRARVAAIFQHVYSQSARETLVRAAVADTSFHALVRYEGNDRTFAFHLIECGQNYGAPVLVDLLRECKHHVGDDIEATFADVFATLGNKTGASVRKPAAWNIEPPHESFTGRASELDAIASAFQSVRRVALVGIAGAGKTQIARKYAARVRETFAHGFEIVADTDDTLRAGLVAVARAAFPGTYGVGDDAQALADATTLLETRDDVLVIVDNVDDAAVWNRVAWQRWRGRILLTGRDEACAAGCEAVAIETLAPDAAADLLVSYILPSQRKTTARADLIALAGELDGLPLAVAQAGAYIADTRGTVAAYLADLRANPVQVLAERDGDDRLQRGNVVATVQKSLERLRETAPASAELLTWCAFLADAPVPARISKENAKLSARKWWKRGHVWRVIGPELGAAASEEREWDKCVAALDKIGLLTGSVTGESLSIHRTTGAAVRALAPDADASAHFDRVCALVCAAYDHNAPDKWEYMAAMMPHMLHCVAECDKRGLATTNAAHVANLASNILSGRGEYDRAEALYVRAEAIFAASEGSESKNVWAMRHNWATTLTSAGRHGEAAALLERVLVFDEAHRGATHRDTGKTLHELGGAYCYAGDYSRAEALYRRSLLVWETNGGAETPDYAATLNSLGLVCNLAGRRDEALAFYTQSLALTRPILSPEHPDLAGTLYNRARFHHDAGDAATALPFYREAVAIYRKHLLATHPNRLQLEQDYARCLRDLGLTEDDAAAMASDTSSP